MKKGIQKIYRAAAILSVMLLSASMVPIAVLSWFDYATGDDLGYSASLHRLMQSGGTIPEAVRLICEEVKNSWYTWQGTWSSLFLFHLQPGIWGERAYALTPWIAIGCIMIGTWILMKVVLDRELGLSRDILTVIYCGVIVCSVQYMPKMRGGIFWYTSVAHYIIPYGVTLLAAAWSIRFLKRGSVLSFLGCLAALTYLGGAGYPEVVFSVMWYLALIFCEWTGITALSSGSGDEAGAGQHKGRKWLLLIPVAAEMAGFVVSAAAPGNKVRGGEGFGFSLGLAVNTVWESILQGIGGILDSFTECRLLLLLFPGIFLLSFIAFRPETVRRKLRMPLLILVLGILICCAVRAPEIYAGVDVSGGVSDSYFLYQNLIISLALSYAACSLKQALAPHFGKLADKAEQLSYAALAVFAAAAAVFCVMERREIVIPTVDYTCYEFAASGQLKDFEAQMQERLLILNNEQIRDAVVPEMNSEQGPFMHMCLLGEKDAFTNYVTAQYYGKDSVIAVPRDIFYERYAEDMLPDASDR